MLSKIYFHIWCSVSSQRKKKRRARRDGEEKGGEERERREERKEKNNKTSEKVAKSNSGQKIYLDSQVELSHERRDAEIEQSGLTEEHAYPDSLPVPSSSAENSNKRKRPYCYTSERSSSIDQICSCNRSLPNAVVHGLEILQCKDLLEKFFLPELHDKGDSDWLYPDRRSEDVRGEKRQRYGRDASD